MIRAPFFEVVESDLCLYDVGYDGLLREIAKMSDMGGVEVSVIGSSDGIVPQSFDDYSEYSGNLRDVGERSLFSIDILPRKECKCLVFIVAGAHAVEPAGPAAAIELPHRFLSAESGLADNLRDHLHFTIIPMVDVDQFSMPIKERRYSPLNQFYHRLEEEPEFSLVEGCTSRYRIQNAGPEAKAVACTLRDRMKTLSVPAFTFDLHEFWYEYSTEPNRGFFIYLHEDTAKTDYAKYALNAVNDAQLPTTYTRVGHIRRQFALRWNFSQYSEELGAVSFTQESPTIMGGEVVPLTDRVSMHLNSIKGALEHYK